MRSITVALLAILGALAGCDTLYGVNRSARLEGLPSQACIFKVASRTEGIASVELIDSSAGTGTTSTEATHPAPTVYHVIYRGTEKGHILGVLQVASDRAGTVVFSQSLQGINTRPPQKDIDTARAIMTKVEEGVEAECGIAQLSAKINERCLGVQCQPLASHILDKAMAVKVAIATWEPMFGKAQIAREAPYQANLSAGVWTVTGTPPQGAIGDVAAIEINAEDGRILRVWHGQ